MLQANVIETPQKSLERYEVKYILHGQAMCGSSHSTHQSASISQKSSEIHQFFFTKWSFSQIYPTIFSYDIFSKNNSNSIPMFGQLKWQLLCHFFSRASPFLIPFPISCQAKVAENETILQAHTYGEVTPNGVRQLAEVLGLDGGAGF